MASPGSVELQSTILPGLPSVRAQTRAAGASSSRGLVGGGADSSRRRRELAVDEGELGRAPTAGRDEGQRPVGPAGARRGGRLEEARTAGIGGAGGGVDEGEVGGPPEGRRAGGRPKLAAVAGRRRRGRQEEEAPVEAGGAAGAGLAGTRGVDRREDLAAACRRRGWRVDKDEWREKIKKRLRKKKRKK